MAANGCARFKRSYEGFIPFGVKRRIKTAFSSPYLYLFFVLFKFRLYREQTSALPGEGSHCFRQHNKVANFQSPYA